MFADADAYRFDTSRRPIRWLVVSVVAACSSCLSQPSDLTPKIHVPDMEVDLGGVAITPEGHRIDFPVFNRGTSTLLIERLVVSCTCTGAKPTATEIAPGDRAEIRVRIKPDHIGERTTSVAVHTNDATRPRVMLQAHWKAVEAVEFDPVDVDFGEVLRGNALTRKVRIVRRPALGAGSPDQLAVSPEGALDARLDGGDVLLSLRAPDRLGDQAATVTLLLNGGSLPTVSLPVRWRVRETVESVPESLYLGAGPPGGPGRRVLVVSAVEGHRLDMKSVRLEGIDGSASWRPAGDRHASVTIDAVLPSRPGLVSGAVVVECETPEPVTLRVPVSALVRDAADRLAGG